ncbi:MAG: hypothetical protein SF182_07220 [Deltaproteobacteria bacterium]|nr:hypothetical protein [Deltaproteobacteria bacterium]
MKRTLLTLCALAALLAVAGCSTFNPNAPASDPNVLAVQSAGDLGALSCAVLVTQLDAEDVAKAKVATAAAQAVLTQPEPSLSALSAALTAADLPPNYVMIGSLVVQRVRVRLGQAELIPVDSVGFNVATSFLDACAAAFMAAPTA